MIKLRKKQWAMLIGMFIFVFISVFTFQMYQRVYKTYQDEYNNLEYSLSKESSILKDATEHKYKIPIYIRMYITEYSPYWALISSLPDNHVHYRMHDKNEVLIFAPIEDNKIIYLFPESLREHLSEKAINQSEALNKIEKDQLSREGAIIDNLSRAYKVSLMASFIESPFYEKAKELVSQAQDLSELTNLIDKIKELENGLSLASNPYERSQMQKEIDTLEIELVGKYNTKIQSIKEIAGKIVSWDSDVRAKELKTRMKNANGYRVTSIVFLIISLLYLFATITAFIVYRKESITVSLMRYAFMYRCDDQDFLQFLLNEYENDWIQSDDLEEIKGKIEIEFSYYVRRQMLLQRKQSAPTIIQKQQSHVAQKETQKGKDKRQIRKENRKNRLKSQEYFENEDIKEDLLPDEFTYLNQLDLMLAVMEKISGSFAHLDEVGIGDLNRMNRCFPDLKQGLSNRLLRKWMNQFDGRDKHTYEPILRILEQKDERKWEAIREFINKKEQEYLHPIQTHPFIDVSFLKQKRIVVIGGRPQLKDYYVRVLKDCGVYSAQWYDGHKDIHKIKSRKVDIVLFLFYGLSHATSNSVKENILNQNTCVLFSDKDSMSLFLRGIVDAYNRA